ncbi:endonuclease domain-containing protein [Candidatus Peregrinibacteria bacterium]|nr:endonuclease domain-containing protein [Candidatus Peregrinibacteria bacterium]
MNKIVLGKRSKRTLWRAKSLRKRSTRPEIILWEKLRCHRLRGLKFRRQVPIGKFIVDFYCHEHRLVVEVDGLAHELLHKKKDKDRDQLLQRAGYKVLRIPNNHVYQCLDGALFRIAHACEKNAEAIPSPSTEGEG